MTDRWWLRAIGKAVVLGIANGIIFSKDSTGAALEHSPVNPMLLLADPLDIG